MIVQCQKCGKRYRIKDSVAEKYRQSGFGCRVCRNQVFLNPIEKKQIQKNNLQIHPQEQPQGHFVDTDTYQPKSTPTSDTFYKVRWNKSIQFKFGAILSAVIILILVIFTMITLFATKKRMTAELNQLALNTATRMSKSMLTPLWELDESQAQENIYSEMLDKKIYGVIVKDNDINAIFQGGRRDKNWQIQQTKEMIDGDFISSNQIINKDDEIIGSVEVYVTKKYMHDESFGAVRNLMITTLILISSILITTFLTMQRIVIQPILFLTESAEEISLGDLKAEIAHHSEDEVGHLAIALDRMRESLKIALIRCEERG